MADLVTDAKVKTALNITDTKYDTQIAQVRPAVEEFVRRFTGLTFDNQTGINEKINGEWQDRIFLSEYPVNGITSIHESTDWPRVYDATTLLVSGTDYVLEEAATGVVFRIDALWPDGVQAIQVIYNAGYATIPSDIEGCVINAVGNLLFRLRDKLMHLSDQSKGDGSIDSIVRQAFDPFAMGVLELRKKRRF